MERGPTLSPTSTEQMQVSPKQVADNFLGWVGVLEDRRAGVERRMEEMSITPSPSPSQQPPPTQPSPRPPLTLPPSRGETGPTLGVTSPELEHLVLARPSPHGTPVRSTPREPRGGGPSSEEAGGSTGARVQRLRGSLRGRGGSVRRVRGGVSREESVRTRQRLRGWRWDSIISGCCTTFRCDAHTHAWTHTEREREREIHTHQ